MSSKSFEDRIRERLNEAKLQPRPEVWQKLETRIPKQEKRWPFWGWLTEGGFLTLLLILWLIPAMNMEGTHVLPKAAIQQSMKDTDSTLPSDESTPSSSLQTEASSLSSTITKTESTQTSTIKPQRNNSRTISSPESTNNSTKNLATTPLSSHTFHDRILGQEGSLLPIASLSETETPKTEATDTHTQELSEQTLTVVEKQKVFVNISHISIENTLLEKASPQFSPRKELESLHKPSRWALNIHHHLSTQTKPIDFLQIKTEDMSFVSTPPKNDTLYTLDQPKRYFHLAADLEYFFHRNRRWSVQGGLGFMFSESGRVEQSIYPGGVLQDTTVTQSGGNIGVLQNIADQALENTRGAFRSRRLTIPLYLNHYVYKGRSALTFSVGGMYSVSWHKEQTLTDINSAFRAQNYADPNPNISPVPDFYLTQRRKQFHLLGRTLYQYQLGKSMSIYGGPSFRYNLKPEYESNLITQEQKWQMGLEVGLKWWLK